MGCERTRPRTVTAGLLAMKIGAAWRIAVIAAAAAALVLIVGASFLRGESPTAGTRPTPSSPRPPALPRASADAYRLVEAAKAQVGVTVSYDPSYVPLDYPGGDVAAETGVCTDVVVRAFRGVGIDLQREVHEDMKGAFSVYPRRWGLSAPDPNIDHRRVPNLETYFARQDMKLPITADGRDYLPGDLVTWSLQGRPHIGIVADEPAAGGEHYLIIHNIGRGTRVEDVLFAMEITGHYRWR